MRDLIAQLVPKKLYSDTHAFLYRLTGGAIGGRFRGRPTLLLTTFGRKTGKPRTVPLLYLPDGDNMVIIASNGGSDQHPMWWLNLEHNPAALARVGQQTRRVTAELADPDERRRLWPLIVQMFSVYDEYQQGTSRQIPVVVLRPLEPATSS